MSAKGPSAAPTFAIDFRSLRLFRIGLGVFLLADLLLRLGDLVSLHSGDGVLPAATLLSFADRWSARISLFFLSDSTTWAATLFLAMAFCGTLLIYGRWPRVVSLVAFVLALSIRNRNPYIAYGGDDLFRLCLIWSAFLPSGPRHENEKNFVSPATLAVFIQAFTLYFSAGMNKITQAWWHEGNAAYLALSAMTYTRPQAALLLQFPTFLQLSSAGVFLLERVGWILFFLPRYHALGRTIGFFLFSAMHIGFGAFLHVELFPLIDVIFISLLLPTEFWDRLKLQMPSAVFSASRADRFLAPCALALAVIVVTINMAQLPQVQRQVWRPIRQISGLLGINQDWSMFAPIDNVSSGYHQVIARSPAGEMVDLLNGKRIEKPPPKPRDVQSMQRGFRWTRQLDGMVDEAKPELIAGALKYFCRGYSGWQVSWNYYRERALLAPGLSPLTSTKAVASQVCP